MNAIKIISCLYLVIKQYGRADQNLNVLYSLVSACNVFNVFKNIDILYQVYGQYSPTIFKNVLSLVLQIISSYLEAFECNKTSDWLNHTV